MLKDHKIQRNCVQWNRESCVNAIIAIRNNVVFDTKNMKIVAMVKGIKVCSPVECGFSIPIEDRGDWAVSGYFWALWNANCRYCE